MIDRRNFLDQPINSDLKTYATGQGDDKATGCLSDYFYFKDYYKILQQI